VIGLGIIGKPIAERLLKAGRQVCVYDVRSEPVSELQRAGANACASCAEVAAASDIVISLVLDRAQTNDVVFGANGILRSIKPGSILAIGSTLGPEPVIGVAKALAEKRCDTLDMPITGGYIAAYEGTLSLMIGGAQSVLERALPAFRTFAETIIRAGDIGAGQAAKLAHQLTMTISVMGLLEGLALGTAAGVDPAILKQILKSGMANSKVLEVWDELGPRWKKMLEPAPADIIPPNLRKDMHSALELAHDLGIPLYIGTQASLIADAGIATGHDNALL